MKRYVMFEALSNLRDNLIEESLALFDGTALPMLPKRQHPVLRFLSSGAGVAVICAVVSLGVLGGIVWAGRHAPTTPTPPITSTQETEVVTETTPDITTETTTLDTEEQTKADTPTETQTEAHTEAPTTPPTPVVDVWNGSVATAFASGKGTQADPYVIETGAQLAYLARQVNSGKTYAATTFVLGADLNLNGKAWTPIGMYEKPFKGNFDGKGHTISGLNVTAVTLSGDRACVGLFGHMSDGSLQNIELVSPKVQLNLDYDAAYAYVSALCGRYECPQLDRDVSIENCRVTGASITLQKGDRAYIGGVVGYVYAHDGCDIGLSRVEGHATIKVTSTYTAHSGGVAGYLYCKSSGRIEVENFCGYTTASALKDGTQYIGTIGAISATEGRVTLRNGYGKVDVTGELSSGTTHNSTYKNDGYAIVGMIYDGAAEKRYYFYNLYGELTAQNMTRDLYFCYYPVESGIDQSATYPKAGVLDKAVWNLSNIKKPTLIFP